MKKQLCCNRAKYCKSNTCMHYSEHEEIFGNSCVQRYCTVVDKLVICRPTKVDKMLTNIEKAVPVTVNSR